ncbi:MAG: hypothetical protein RL307_840 [Pseudomonadota bacterium]
MSKLWQQRALDSKAREQLIRDQAHPLLAQLWAARGVSAKEDMDLSLSQMLDPLGMKGMAEAAADLADAIEAQARMVIVADYDCDGATACAVGMRGLRMLGATGVQAVVPDRARDGYGLTPSIADRVKALDADWLVTVDNGIASVEGVAHARQLGLKVLITDHHLPGDRLPEAHHLVNPNQPGCTYPSKHLSGVGVMFMLLVATRAVLRQRAPDSPAALARLDRLLPLVALGTVADLVRLDVHNRRLVHQGLQRIRTGVMPEGLKALFEVSGRDHREANASDLGFALGPRINAAGRLSDMHVGIACLSEDDPSRARELAQQLDAINRQRRNLQDDMNESALALAESAFQGQAPKALCVFHPDFHEGVVGIVASRLKEKWHRPSFVFAANATEPDQLRGSGRSITGFHLRDALDLIAKRHPGLLIRFGGHAMAAGCTIARAGLSEFAQAFADLAQTSLAPEDLEQQLMHDGPLPAQCLDLNTAQLLRDQVWGQAFPEPVFCDSVRVHQQHIVGEKHLRLRIEHQGQMLQAIWFGRTEPVAEDCRIAYVLDTNTWQGTTSLQLRILDGQ